MKNPRDIYSNHPGRYLQQLSWEISTAIILGDIYSNHPGRMPYDPMILFEMVVGNLFGQFHKMVWNVSEVFGGIEHISFQLLRLRVLVTLANYKPREL